jgi:hypothetical protein
LRLLLDGMYPKRVAHVVPENVRGCRPSADARVAAGETHRGVVLTTRKRWPRANIGAAIGALDRLLASTSEQPIDRALWL